jgi:hypothetical protein
LNAGDSPGEIVDSLADAPLGDLQALPLLTSGPASPSTGAAIAAAGLGSRTVAFAADLAGSSLAVTLAIVAAAAVTGRAPRLPGLPWAAAFGLGFSFFFVVLPLMLFGRTVGMSLAGLSARPGPPGRRLTVAEAGRRWLGTALAAVTAGIPLLFTRRDPTRPTPADRWSGRALVKESEP